MALAGRLAARLQTSTSALFVCDIQERFRPIIAGYPTVIDTAKRMVKGADLLGVPIVATEQAPKALGSTVSEIMEVLPTGTPRYAKTLFSMYTPEVDAWLKAKPNVNQVVLLGIEAHVCVLQTALDLIARGYSVHLVTDGISSSRPHHRAAGLHRMGTAGACMETSESVLFQLMADAKHPKFKEVSAIVKEGQQAPGFTFTSNL